MSISEFIALFTIAFVFVITPGPGTLAVFAKSLAQGNMPAFYLSVGLVAGDLIYLSAVIFSLDLFADIVNPLMDYVRVLGGIYLIYLGINAYNAHKINLENKVENKSNNSEFFTGLMISMVNPKVMIFYIAILPAFTDLSQLNLMHAFEILTTVGVSLLVGISMINIMVVRIKNAFASGGINKTTNKIVGAIMVVAGVLLGVS